MNSYQMPKDSFQLMDVQTQTQEEQTMTGEWRDNKEIPRGILERLWQPAEEF